MEYTLNQLINEWKVRKGIVPLRTDATITRQDAFEIDEYITRIIDSWYVKLLDTGPIEYLDVTDISSEVTITAFSRGVATIQLPEHCRRVIEISMTEWQRPATIVTDCGSHEARRQGSPFARGGAVRPVAVVESAGTVRLYSFKTAPVIDRILAVVTPRDGMYRCDPRALESLFNTNDTF